MLCPLRCHTATSKNLCPAAGKVSAGPLHPHVGPLWLWPRQPREVTQSLLLPAALHAVGTLCFGVSKALAPCCYQPCWGQTTAAFLSPPPCFSTPSTPGAEPRARSTEPVLSGASTGGKKSCFVQLGSFSSTHHSPAAQPEPSASTLQDFASQSFVRGSHPNRHSSHSAGCRDASGRTGGIPTRNAGWLSAVHALLGRPNPGMRYSAAFVGFGAEPSPCMEEPVCVPHSAERPTASTHRGLSNRCNKSIGK